MIRIILNHGNWPPWWLNYSEDVHWFSSSTVRNLTSDSPRSKQPQFGFCCSNDSNWSRWMFSVGCDGPSWAPRFGASPSPHLGSISLEHPEILIALIHPENLGVETKGNSVTCFFVCQCASHQFGLDENSWKIQSLRLEPLCFLEDVEIPEDSTNQMQRRISIPFLEECPFFSLRCEAMKAEVFQTALGDSCTILVDIWGGWVVANSGGMMFWAWTNAWISAKHMDW